MKSIQDIAKDCYNNYASFAEIIDPNTAADYAEEVHTEYMQQFKEQSIAYNFFKEYRNNKKHKENAISILDWYIDCFLKGLSNPIQSQLVNKSYLQFEDGDYKYEFSHDEDDTYVHARVRVPIELYTETASSKFDLSHLEEVVIREGHKSCCVNTFIKDSCIIQITITI